MMSVKNYLLRDTNNKCRSVQLFFEENKISHRLCSPRLGNGQRSVKRAAAASGHGGFNNGSKHLQPVKIKTYIEQLKPPPQSIRCLSAGWPPYAETI